jgi:excisionase family DNA binding protein
VASRRTVTAVAPSPWMGIKAASEYSGFHSSTLRKALKSGRLKGHSVEGSRQILRFHREDLDAWIRGARQEPTPTVTPDEWLSLEDASLWTKFSKGTLKRAIKSRLLQATVGAPKRPRWRFRRDALNSWVLAGAPTRAAQP